MPSSEVRPDRIPLPERIDRTMRFGPFPSVRNALRFVAYSVVGAVLVPWIGLWAWLPVVGVAFLLTVWQVDGVALDERIAGYVRWSVRSHREDPMSRRAAPAHTGDSIRLASGMRVAILRCAGAPVAFLPPEELVRRFREYRDLLRTCDGGIVFASVGTPIDARPWMPPAPTGTESGDAAARSAYGEMVRLLCARRRRRRVYVLLWDASARSRGSSRLEDRVQALRQRLAALGAEPERLRDGSLATALRHFGWTEGRGAPA